MLLRVRFLLNVETAVQWPIIARPDPAPSPVHVRTNCSDGERCGRTANRPCNNSFEKRSLFFGGREATTGNAEAEKRRPEMRRQRSDDRKCVCCSQANSLGAKSDNFPNYNSESHAIAT